jgi:hypothetical protein
MTAESQTESHAKVCRAQVILCTFNKLSPNLSPSFFKRIIGLADANMAVTETANLDAAEEKVKIIKSGVDLVLDRLMVFGNE